MTVKEILNKAGFTAVGIVISAAFLAFLGLFIWLAEMAGDWFFHFKFWHAPFMSGIGIAIIVVFMLVGLIIFVRYAYWMGKTFCVALKPVAAMYRDVHAYYEKHSKGKP